MAAVRATGRGAWGLVAALAAAAFIHREAFSAPFFADDWLFLEAVRGKSLWGALLARDPLGNYFRPLGRAAWFWAVGHASGESATAFHAANFLLFLVAIALLWLLARKLAGEAAATIAAAVFALTCAADVPLLWACGAQDLLAVALALGALLAVAHDVANDVANDAARHGVNRRRALACVLLLLAPLAKESVALASLPALLLARRAGEPWRSTLKRAWCYPAMTLVWAGAAAFALAHARANGSGLALSPWGPVAAVVALVRTTLGLEWASDRLPWLPVAWPQAGGLAALVAVTLSVGFFAEGWPRSKAFSAAAASAARPREKRRASAVPAAPVPPTLMPRALLLAAVIGWIVAGTAPVAVVAPLWSAYYLLFAMSGVAMLAGVLLARFPRGVATVAVVALGLAAHQARAVEEFATAPSPWSAQSHVNRFYLERGMRESARVIAELRAALPTLAPRTTVLFAGIPAWSAVQTGDGPVVRGVYRDSSLRSYYLSQFEPAMLARGPIRIVFKAPEDAALVDHTNEPGAWARSAYGMLLDGHLAAADAALAQALHITPGDAFARYTSLWTAYALGHRARADSLARAQGFTLRADGAGAVAAARAKLAVHDSVAAVVILRAARSAYFYDADLHGAIADVLLRVPQGSDEGAIEAFAAVTLAPNDARAWRRWGLVQMLQTREAAAMRSLDRYSALAPKEAAADPEAQEWRRVLTARLPGGSAAQASLRTDR